LALGLYSCILFLELAYMNVTATALGSPVKVIDEWFKEGLLLVWRHLDAKFSAQDGNESLIEQIAPNWKAY
jgi:hypothetical protein